MKQPVAYENFHLQYIGGEWREGRSGRSLENRSPYNQQLLFTIPLANREDLNDAYVIAEQAQVAWASTGPAERSAVLLKAVEIFDQRRDEIISWLIRESGSTRIKAEIELASARSITLEAASFPSRIQGRILSSNILGKESRVYRKPLGVVGIISPWNFPLHLTQRSLVPALALGNAVVLKPASETPITGGLLLARIFEEAGLPPGVLSVVVGSGAEIGDTFVDHPVPALISFTGSTDVGRRIGRLASGGQHLKHLALELGGNSPFVVLADADLEQAAHAAVVGKFLHIGQICMAINRIIVEQPVYERFIELFVERVSRLPIGDPTRPETVIGPVINTNQLDGLQKKIAQAKADGARVLLEAPAQGLVLPPHVFADVQPSFDIAKNEIFGPLVGILAAQDENHALELANNSEYGLSSAVFSGSLEHGVAFAKRIRAGMSHVNDIPVNDEANAPFGGEKNSGIGRFNGDWAIEEFTSDHWISVQHEPRTYPF